MSRSPVETVAAAGPLSGGEGQRRALEDERAFLLASLEDLEREREAGDITDADYATLRDRYTERAARVLRALEDRAGDVTGAADAGGAATGTGTAGRADDTNTGPATPARSAPPRPRRRRRALGVGGAALVLAGVTTMVVLRQTGPRLPGASATGSVSLGKAQRVQQTLQQAETLQQSGDGTEAVALYHQVLAQDPNQPTALAQLGWLLFEAGVQGKDAALLSQAQSFEERAQRVAPGTWTPHLYLGSMLLAEGEASAAVTQYRLFLRDTPPVAQIRTAEPFIVKAFTDAKEPLPSLPTG